MFRAILALIFVFVLELATNGAVAFRGANAAEGGSAAGDSPGLVVTAQAGEIRRHKPGAWTVLVASAANHGDEDRTGMVSTYFAPRVEQQFARQIWVPAHAFRTSWLPIPLPTGLAKNVSQQQLTMISTEVSADGRQLLQRHERDLLTNTMPILLDHEPGMTGTYLQKPLPDEHNNSGKPDADAYDLILRARGLVDLSPIVVDLSNDFLPPWSESLQGLEHIVLTADRITDDAAGMVTLRSWVRNGGRLWVMLDRTSPQTVRALLGNAMNFTVVDRVALDEFDLETIEPGSATNVEHCEYDQPIDCVRVLLSSGEVTHRAGGWPAAFWQSYGEGELLFTTINPRGWHPESSNRPRVALQKLSTRFFSGREGRIDPRHFQAPLQQKIGYRIPSRQVAMYILGGYCSALLLAGWRFATWRRLDALAWFAPGITLVASVALVAIGRAHSTGIPPTIVTGQILRFEPDANEVRVEGLAAIYDQRTNPLELAATRREWILPDPPADNEVRRLVWNDQDQLVPWNTAATAGSVGLSTLTGTRELPWSVAAEARFGEKGLEGRLKVGGLIAVTDTVIVAQPGANLAVQLNDDFTWQADADQPLPEDQFIPKSILSDQQRRQQDFCRRLFDATDTFQFPRSPSLLFWCDPLRTGVEFPAGYQQSGTALAMVPVTVHRSPPDSRFRIPPSFITMDGARLPPIEGVVYNASAYNRRNGKWVQGMTTTAEIPLRFQLPQQVLPCAATGGQMTIRISAPSRDLQLWTYGGQGRRLLRTLRNPLGVVTIDLSEDELHLDDQGGLTFGFAVTASQGPARRPAAGGSGAAGGADAAGGAATPPVTVPVPANADNWQIDYVRLSIDGRTLPLSE
ncbi:MAG: hypothetical protein FJ295_10455 [Planctomycetes bacterium]|nr:hypothetical protein [Planctomycetota bacterium]